MPEGFVAHVGIIRVDTEDLRLTLTASVLEVTVNVFEGLVDLLIKILRHLARGTVPTA